MQKPKIIKKAYKYRIYPTKEQEIFFAKTFGCCRLVWNKMLAEKLSAYRKREPIPQITPAKYKEEVDSLALANVQLQLEKAFRNHLKNPKHFGLPKFKRKRGKAEWYGRTFIQVDGFFPSSKLCHCRGYKKPVEQFTSVIWNV